MTDKVPVVLVVLVEGARLRWFVAALDLGGGVVPLLRSEDGDLGAYRGLSFDDQVSFLRHRFCGVVQRGCDRLWPAGRKPCQFAFLFAGPLPDASAELIPRLADHFAEWMLSPPAVVFARAAGFDGTAPLAPSWLAGTIERPAAGALDAGLAPLLKAAADPDVWEVSQRKGTWRPPEDRD
jgi:hypothetical protein